MNQQTFLVDHATGGGIDPRASVGIGSWPLPSGILLNVSMAPAGDDHWTIYCRWSRHPEADADYNYYIHTVAPEMDRIIAKQMNATTSAHLIV